LYEKSIVELDVIVWEVLEREIVLLLKPKLRVVSEVMKAKALQLPRVKVAKRQSNI
jgi:hypothetical protein